MDTRNPALPTSVYLIGDMEERELPRVNVCPNHVDSG